MTTRSSWVALGALLLAACGSDASSGTVAEPAPATSSPAGTPAGTVETRSVADLLDPEHVVRLVPQVIGTVGHDTTASTQGLEYHDGVLLESTGGYTTSDRRRVDPESGAVVQRVALPPTHFGEGLTVADGHLFQLTWQEGVAHLADPRTLEALDQRSYSGEGWGICFDGERLVMSDGSDVLTFRDPATFEPTGSVDVTLDGEPVPLLNELECDDGLIWANIFQRTDIVAIDPGSGQVRAVADAASLVPEGLEGDRFAPLNGIARRPGTDTFWLTGKLWPVLYEVRLVPGQ